MKPTLPMNPTGWFQVAWSHEVTVGQVHRMRYFGRDLVAWRATSGKVTVMDAYCEHLGAHLGYGGTVVEDRIRCPFHGWEWNDQGRNVCIPYEDRPNIGKKIRTMPMVERALGLDKRFDPGTARQAFTVCISDYAMVVLAPALRRRIEQEAPGVRIDYRPMPPDLLVKPHLMSEADLVLCPRGLGLVGTSVDAFEDRFVCVVDPGNARLVEAGST